MTEQTKFLLDEQAAEGVVHHQRRHAYRRRSRCCIRARWSRVTPISWPCCSRWRSSCGDQHQALSKYLEDRCEDLQAVAATPFIRARRLNERWTPRPSIYFKYEGVSPVGSHQTEHASRASTRGGQQALTTETGAGQSGRRWRWRAAFRHGIGGLSW